MIEHRQRQRAPVNLHVFGGNKSCSSVVRKEHSAGSRKGLTNRRHSEFSVVYQLFSVVVTVVRLLKVTISVQLPLVKTSFAETKQVQL